MEHFGLSKQKLYDATQLNKEQVNCYFLGDSLTFGWTSRQKTIPSTNEEIISGAIYKTSYEGGTKPYYRERFKDNLTDVFANIVTNEYSDSKLNCVNIGYPDYTALEMLKELVTPAPVEDGVVYPSDKLYPDGVYFLMFGQNDSDELTLADFIRNMERLIHECEFNNVPAVLMIEPTNLGGDNKKLKSFKDSIIPLAVQYGIKCIDFRNIEYIEEDYLTLDNKGGIKDTIHMSSYGYKKMANYLFNELFINPLQF